MQKFEIIQDLPRNAHVHMEIDRTLVMDGNSSPRIRIYEWLSPVITAGIFSEPERLLDSERCRACRMEVVKRPTGGGVLFHDKDLVCAVFIPNATAVEPVCEAINAKVRAALTPFLPELDAVPFIADTRSCRFCMAQTAALDLICEGRKIGGCAQRKTRAGILHHISIFLNKPDWETIASCVLHARDISTMQETSTSLEELSSQPIDRQSVREAIVQQFEKEGVTP